VCIMCDASVLVCLGRSGAANQPDANEERGDDRNSSNSVEWVE